MIIKRDMYLNRLIGRKWNGMVKVVTGIRRCGKSFLLFRLFKDHLINESVKESEIIEMNLELPGMKKYHDPKALYNYLVESTSDGRKRYYVLIDEIQMTEDFESVLNGMLGRDNVDVYVTGSNSRFLSTDIITEFRGRSDEINVRPLSFSEFLSVYDGNERDALGEYMTYGGLPEVVKLPDAEQKAQYLRNLCDVVYLRDIIERHNISSPDVLNELTDAVSSSVGSLSNPNRMKDILNSNGRRKLSDKTVSAYLDYLRDAFLFEESKRYDIKGNRYLNHLMKYYSVDPGIRNARLNFRQPEYGHIMENIVFNELRSRGYSVDVGIIGIRENTKDGKSASKNLEIDFVANKGSERIYVQSAYRMDTDEKRNTEIRPFLRTDDFFRRIVVHGYDEPKHTDERGILFIGIIDFLVDEEW